MSNLIASFNRVVFCLTQGTHIEWKQINVPSLSKMTSEAFFWIPADFRVVAILLSSPRFKPPLLFWSCVLVEIRCSCCCEHGKLGGRKSTKTLKVRYADHHFYLFGQKQLPSDVKEGEKSAEPACSIRCLKNLFSRKSNSVRWIR